MSDYVQTGIPGVDAILGGVGISQGHTILISGGPGSGKTCAGYLTHPSQYE
jgi:KaiC/GvpD/RAD55 family RecA-like ATPase